MIYAVYRCLYGEDFVKYSIESVLPHVDKVFVVYAGKPFADITETEYEGKIYRFPEKFDGLLENIPDDPKIHVIHHYYDTPRNQWTRIMNELIVPEHGMPDDAVFMHVPMVWREGEFTKALDQFRRDRHGCAVARQIDVWRGFDWRLPERKRASAGFVRLKNKAKMQRTGLDPWLGDTLSVPLLDAQVHNFRYAQNPNVMFWRQVVVSEYVKTTVDSKPNPRFFADKWFHWTPETTDLEMALNWMHLIPKALPYDIEKLPASIRRDISMLRDKTSNTAWRGYPQCE